MGGEDNGQSLEELARRIEAQTQRLEAIERENQELRETLGSGASDSRSERPQQQPRVTRPKEMTVASSKTVRALLLGPRDEQAYSRPFVGVLSSYVVGWLLTCAVAAYGSYIAFFVTAEPVSPFTDYQDDVVSYWVGINWLWLAPMAALLFGVYGGTRDGDKFVFARFQYVGLFMAIGTTLVVFLTSIWIVQWSWGGQHEDIGFAMGSLIADELNSFVMGTVFVSTWLLFVSGALLGTALQLWTSEKEQAEREGSTQGSDEGRPPSISGVRAQVWPHRAYRNLDRWPMTFTAVEYYTDMPLRLVLPRGGCSAWWSWGRSGRGTAG